MRNRYKTGERVASTTPLAGFRNIRHVAGVHFLTNHRQHHALPPVSVRARRPTRKVGGNPVVSPRRGPLSDLDS